MIRIAISGWWLFKFPKDVGGALVKSRLRFAHLISHSISELVKILNDSVVKKKKKLLISDKKFLEIRTSRIIKIRFFCEMPRKRRCTEMEDSDDDDDSRHPQRNAANARERARMRVLSKAFCRLKTTLPWVPADTKLSKLDTLRLATSYIAHLRAVLMDQPVPSDQIHKHPLTLTWPYSFQRSESNPDATNERESQIWGDLSIQPVVRDKDISYYY